MSASVLHPASPAARRLKALQRVPCGGCGLPFEPTRRDQKHCRPGCRRLALERRRRRLPLFDDDPGDLIRLDGSFE
jgi:hypothetical protein